MCGRLWISRSKRRVIHGHLVAPATVPWSRPSRKTAAPRTVTWSRKPILIPISLPFSCSALVVDNSEPPPFPDSKHMAYRSVVRSFPILSAISSFPLRQWTRYHRDPFCRTIGRPYRRDSDQVAPSLPEDFNSSIWRSLGPWQKWLVHRGHCGGEYREALEVHGRGDLSHALDLNHSPTPIARRIAST